MKKYNFSKRGWMNIVLCFFLYVINNACTTDGENVVLPKLAALHNWDYSKVLMLATLAGCLSIIGQLAFGRLCAKKGPKFTMVLCLFLTSGFLLIYGSAGSLWMYAVGLFGVICCSTSYAYIAAQSLIANWFPQKKGLALGFVSMGSPFSTIVMVSLLTFLITTIGLTKGMFTIAAIVFALGVLCLFVVYDKPEMCGELPDNASKEDFDAMVLREEELGDLTNKEILRNKNFWYIVGIIGVISHVLTGLMAQFIVRYTDSGFSESKAILMLSITAGFGLLGSMIIGRVENQLGTKKAYVIFTCVFIVAFLINFTNKPALIYLSIPLFGCVITMLQIFMTSFQVSVFGRNNFGKVNGLVFPMISMIGQTSFLVISLCIRTFGEVRYAYCVFAALLAISLIFNKKLVIK